MQSSRFFSWVRPMALSGALVGATLCLGGCGEAPNASAGASGGFADDRAVIQMVSTNVQGKNVYIPSTVVLTAGKGQKLSVFNTTDTPHGFSIVGLGVEAILPAGEETEIALPELEGGNVYQLGCQLHPPHRTGTILVLPGQ